MALLAAATAFASCCLTELQKAVSSADYKERVDTLGIEASFAGPTEFSSLIDLEITKWEQFIS